MVQRNVNIAKLPGGYLFPEINRRKQEFLKQNPAAKIISLGIGNTTEPVTPHITAGLEAGAKKLGTVAGYTGYGDEAGTKELRARIASKFYGGIVKDEEIFVSDGAKCDIGRLQILFGAQASFAAQDPSYPVYVDGGVMIGQTQALDPATKQFGGVRYLPCLPENNFFPDLSAAKGVDVIYFCSPNNPTGAVATRAQLEELVKFAQAQRSIIIFDAAYSMYINDPSLPKSIFEIPGARECAVEVHSFSKSAGFTGVRLGWTVVPQELKFDDGTPVSKDWSRVVTTIFNGASNIAQSGGLAALDEVGFKEMHGLVKFYMENAAIIRGALKKVGLTVYGGDNAPYLWVRFPGRSSWDAFADVLSRAHIVTTPGSGFGPAGEGFLRFSAFGHRADIEEAVRRIETVLA